MMIGHTGRTRVEELILAVGLLVIAVRTASPIGTTSVYGAVAIKVTVGLLIAVPAVFLVLCKKLPARRTSLFWVFVTYAYVGLLVPIVDWTRFGTAGAIFALAALSGYLYYVTAEEIKWTQAQSSRSSPPSEPV